MYLSAKPNGKALKNFGGKDYKKKSREKCQIANQQLSSISDIELTRDDQFERLSWLLSVIASILLVNVTVVIIFHEITFKLYNDPLLTNRKIAQQQAKGKISSLITNHPF